MLVRFMWWVVCCSSIMFRWFFSVCSCLFRLVVDMFRFLVVCVRLLCLMICWKVCIRVKEFMIVFVFIVV